MPEGTLEKRAQFEHGLLFVTLFLMGLGIVMVYSATVYGVTDPAVVKETQGNGMFYLMRHLMFVGIGLVFLFGATVIPFRFYERFALPILILGIALMVLVLFIGTKLLGATRWFTVLGFSIQPGEAVKMAFVIWMSYSLASKKGSLHTFELGVAPHFLVALVVVILYLLQPDLASCIILGVVMVSLMFVAGTTLKHIGLLTIVGVPAMAGVILSSEERMNRIFAWLSPEVYRYGDGYQLTQSTISIGSGQFLGPGPGSGAQNIAGYVPESETDFIFSVISEELGFIGSMLVILAFAYILYAGFRLAMQVRDDFARYLAFGVTLLVVIQAAINIGVTTGTLPTKGLTLPFVSMGGSSMVVMAACVGILLNISRSLPRYVRVPHSKESDETVSVFVKEAA